MKGIWRLTFYSALILSVAALCIGAVGLLTVESAPRGPVYGVEIYRQVCIFCHGENGDGQGPVSLASNGAINPRAFTDVEYMNSLSYSQLFTSIKEGIADRGRGMMPPQGQTLSDEQIQEVIKYIKNFYDSEK